MAVVDGTAVDSRDGQKVGDSVVSEVGRKLGSPVGSKVGSRDFLYVGCRLDGALVVGFCDGIQDGNIVGIADGENVGG